MKKININRNIKLKKSFIILLIIIIFLISIYALISNKISNNRSYNINNNTISNIQQNNTNNITISNDLFGKFYQKAELLLETMTLEEKVGQIFLARYPKTEVINEVIYENPGGYILFAKDFKDKTKEQIIQELEILQKNSKINLLLGVDEEGGNVVRVSAYKEFRNTKFLSAQQLFKIGGLQKILEDSTEKSNLLKSIGLNMNLAPVVDISINPSSFIYPRTYGQDTYETAIYSSKLINQMNKDGIVSSLKHFPGYGDNVDTHTGIAVDSRNYSQFENSDFLPFKTGINSGAPCIMVNHNIVNCMDSNKPASLSENVHKILREKLGFSGLIITDDLAMNAVKQYVDNGEAAVQAIIAGNDMIISSSFKNQKQEILNAIKNGKISETTINTAVRRILACKYAYKIIQ